MVPDELKLLLAPELTVYLYSLRQDLLYTHTLWVGFPYVWCFLYLFVLFVIPPAVLVLVTDCDICIIEAGREEGLDLV